MLCLWTIEGHSKIPNCTDDVCVIPVLFVYYRQRLISSPSWAHSNCNMNLFKSVQSFYELMGIHPAQSFNLRNLIFLTVLMAFLLSLLCCFALEPITVLERAESVYLMLTDLASVVNFCVSYRKIGVVFMLIEKANKYIEKSRYFVIYIQCWHKQASFFSLAE